MTLTQKQTVIYTAEAKGQGVSPGDNDSLNFMEIWR